MLATHRTWHASHHTVTHQRGKIHHPRRRVAAMAHAVDPIGAWRSQSTMTASRRGLLAGLAAAISTLVPMAISMPARAEAQTLSPQALQAFKDALSSSGDFQAKDAAWTRVIELAPSNSIAWSNRGTLRLQNARWADAQSDLAHSVALEAHISPAQTEAMLDMEVLTEVDPSTLNNLGNSEVALGRLSDAQVHFQAASRDRGLRAIALQNLALAAFEGRDNQLAIRVARQVLRRYADGQTAAAEGQFDELQNAEDGMGARLYNPRVAIQRVQSRWPPRATAALDAFLTLSPTGTATGYDMQQHSFSFPSS